MVSARARSVALQRSLPISTDSPTDYSYLTHILLFLAAFFVQSNYKVADISLAAFGRKEIALAENEMPGLM